MLAFFNAISPMHLLVILIIALLLFGNRLPEVMRSIGRSVNEFKRGLKDVEDGLNEDGQDRSSSRLRPPPEGQEHHREQTSEKEHAE